MKNKVIFYFVCSILLCVIFVVMVNNKDNSYNHNDDDSNNVEETITTTSSQVVVTKKPRNKKIACYFKPSVSTSIKKFEEEELQQSSKIGQHIFFIETSCPEAGRIVLNPRQACAIESAAKMNPGMNVYLLILSPEDFSDSTKKLVNHLKTYANINIRRVFVEEYVKNTPLAAWWASGVFEKSRWPKEHMSDVLRYLTLWKFPGIYLDLDMVIMSSLDSVMDFAAAENENRVNSAVLRFGASNIGREVAKKCLERIRTKFRGDVWTRNGPDVITNVLQKLCDTNYIFEMPNKPCRGFIVFPPSTFYPIYYDTWEKFFESEDKDETMKIIGNALGIHLWNKLSISRPIQVGDDAPYALIASQYCPRVYYNCGEIF